MTDSAPVEDGQGGDLADTGSAPAEKAPAASGSFAEDWRSAVFLLLGMLLGKMALPGPWILLLPLLLGAVMLWLWLRRGRDPGPPAVAPRYAPPDGLSPGEVGILVDHSLDMRDVTATLAQLAKRGYLEIEERQSPSSGTGTEHVFVRTSEPERWEDLPAHERHFLFALFAEGPMRPQLPEMDAAEIAAALVGGAEGGRNETDVNVEELSREEMFRRLLEGRLEGGQVVRALYGDGRKRVRTSELEDSFYRSIDVLRESFLDRLAERGYYARRPGGRRRIYLLAAIGAVWIGFMGGGALDSLAGVLAGLAVGGMGWIMPARTRKGARAAAVARGYREFLGRVEEDRLRRMVDSPEDFERHLPYAVALGVDTEWADAFASIYSRPDDDSASVVDRIDWPALRDGLRRAARRRDPGGDGASADSS